MPLLDTKPRAIQSDNSITKANVGVPSHLDRIGSHAQQYIQLSLFRRILTDDLAVKLISCATENPGRIVLRYQTHTVTCSRYRGRIYSPGIYISRSMMLHSAMIEGACHDPCEQ